MFSGNKFLIVSTFFDVGIKKKVIAIVSLFIVLLLQLYCISNLDMLNSLPYRITQLSSSDWSAQAFAPAVVRLFE